MALTKAKIADELVGTIGLNRSEAEEFVDTFFEAIRVALTERNPVKLPGFGTFRPRRKRERMGCHPQTGAPMVLSARYVVTFQISHLLAKKLSQQHEPTRDPALSRSLLPTCPLDEIVADAR